MKRFLCAVVLISLFSVSAFAQVPMFNSSTDAFTDETQEMIAATDGSSYSPDHFLIMKT